MQLLQNCRYIMLHRIRRQAQVIRDLLVRPVPAGQHGDREFHRREQSCYLFLRYRIMNLHPAAAEGNHTVHQILIELRLTLADAGLQHSLKESVMLNEWFQEAVRLAILPGGA